MTRRARAADQTRARVVRVARRLLNRARGGPLSLEAVAEAAGVTRQALYKQFGSRRGLLEAVLDELGRQGEAPSMGRAAAHPAGPEAALAALVEGTCRFWATDRLLFRRLVALAVLDPELGRVVAAREARRRAAIDRVVARLAEGGCLGAGWTPESAGAALSALTQFASFDALSEPEPTLQRLARAVLA